MLQGRKTSTNKKAVQIYAVFFMGKLKIAGNIKAIQPGGMEQVKGGVCRYLDLMAKQVQDAVENFTESSAKELFLGTLGRNYKLVSGE